MRTARESALLVAAFSAASALFALACKDSSTVAGPTLTTMPAVSLAGTWTGAYRPKSRDCPSSTLTVTLQQRGADITGTFATASCAMSGGFKGRVEGYRLTGMIDMRGCTGGAVSGELSGSALSLDVGDFYRPLLTENEVVLQGGSATLQR